MALLKSALLAGTAFALIGSPVLAQTAAAEQDKPRPAQSQPEQTPAESPAHQDEAQQEDAASTLSEVEVRATSTTPRTSIDSISYNVGEDLQATTGTLADALRNVPSVEVDPDGNVSLRGNPSVTILVDGRPSPMFEGQTRAQVLQQLPADQYARIEVMTNPSAAHSAEGAGGIINLISKPAPRNQTQKPTQMGSLRLNGGDDRYNLGLNLVRSTGKLTVTANAGLRHDNWEQNQASTTVRYATATRPELTSTSPGLVHGTQDNWFLGTNAQYRMSDSLRLSGNLFYTDISNPIYVDSGYTERDSAGTVVNAYDYDGEGAWEGQIAVGTVGMVKSFGAQGHEWSNDLRLHRMQSRLGLDIAQNWTVPATNQVFDRDITKDLNYNWGFTSAYVRPMDDGSKLRTGYELSYTDQDSSIQHYEGPAMDRLVRDERLTNEYGVQQAVHALYATYERPFGEDFSAQFGLRVEQTNREVEQVATGQKIKWDDLSLYPTLHLSYQLTDQQTLRGSYSRRIERPQPGQLNPNRVRMSPTNYREGNPLLAPRETDSFEVMWQKRVQQTFYQATLFYRDSSGAFTTIMTEVEPGIFLTRPVNLGDSRSTGLELVANGQIMPKLRYSASLTYARVEIDATGLAGSSNRSDNTVAGRLTLDWRPTDKDFLQVSGVWTADQLEAQGVTKTEPLFNLGYRRKINDAWSLQVTARDLANTYGTRSETYTPSFRQESEHIQGGRSLFVGFTWNFGQSQGPRREEQFDFSAPSSVG